MPRKLKLHDASKAVRLSEAERNAMKRHILEELEREGCFEYSSSSGDTLMIGFKDDDNGIEIYDCEIRREWFSVDDEEVGPVKLPDETLEVKKLAEESERRLHQIVACEMAALDPKQVQDFSPDHPYRTPAMNAVLDLRKKYDELKFRLDSLCK